MPSHESLVCGTVKLTCAAINNSSVMGCHWWFFGRFDSGVRVLMTVIEIRWKASVLGFFSDPCEDKFHHMSKQLCCVKPEGHKALEPLLQHLLTVVLWWVTGTRVAPECCSFTKGLTQARHTGGASPSPTPGLEPSTVGRVTITDNKAFPLCRGVWFSKLFHGRFLILFSPRPWEGGQTLLLLSSLGIWEDGCPES